MHPRIELHLRRTFCALERLWCRLVEGNTRHERLEAFLYLLAFFVLVPVGLGASLALGGLCIRFLCEGFAHLLPWLLLGTMIAFLIFLAEWLGSAR